MENLSTWRRKDIFKYTPEKINLIKLKKNEEMGKI